MISNHIFVSMNEIYKSWIYNIYESRGNFKVYATLLIVENIFL